MFCVQNLFVSILALTKQAAVLCNMAACNYRMAIDSVDELCILILLQCRDREWFGDDNGNEAWARDAAENGFAVLRVRTQNWAEVKEQHPEWFKPLFRPEKGKQDVICTLNYIHVLCPLLAEIHDLSKGCPETNIEDCKGEGPDILAPWEYNVSPLTFMLFAKLLRTLLPIQHLGTSVWCTGIIRILCFGAALI